MAVGVIIGNLGTPQSPETKDVGIYLKEFLMDHYVIDKPWWFRWLLVNGIIVPFRSPKSAHAYKAIWQKEGSPLWVYSLALKHSLQKKMGDQFNVEIGMRYGQPSIGTALKKLSHCDRIVLVPLYPQYAESSYETWLQKAKEQIKLLSMTSEIITIPPFYNYKAYLASQTELIKKSYKPDETHLLLSYHGLPIRHLKKLDSSKSYCSVVEGCCDKISEINKNCYRAQCVYTSKKIAEGLGLKEDQWSVSFQSGFGREAWTEPNTETHVDALLKRGIKSLAVATPAFTADCLESLEEIGVRLKEQFLAAGGEEFQLIPCLNDDELWVDSLQQIIVEHLN